MPRYFRDTTLDSPLKLKLLCCILSDATQVIYMEKPKIFDSALKFPELVFGLIGAIGTDTEKILVELQIGQVPHPAFVNPTITVLTHFTPHRSRQFQTHEPTQRLRFPRPASEPIERGKRIY